MGDSSGRGRIRVSCGAEDSYYEGDPITVSGLRRRYRQILNVTDDHKTVFVNGRAADEHDVVQPGSEVEFKKQAGAKG
ncbi:MAG: hypothetical protein G01um101419_617 [Parcubacteria group bacterium Gr01-1014_19]|nr:MAG: hypothetical protein G01um101419_617 [Parcubacteria group bacterium Gr01-1014_19]